MNDEQLRIAIAEATGQWRDCHIVKGQRGDHDMPMGRPLLIDGTFAEEYDVVDNYPGDLNAMHEALLVLTEDQQRELISTLLGYWITPCQYVTLSWQELFKLMSLPASELAETFAATLNPTTP